MSNVKLKSFVELNWRSEHHFVECFFDLFFSHVIYLRTPIAKILLYIALWSPLNKGAHYGLNGIPANHLGSILPFWSIMFKIWLSIHKRQRVLKVVSHILFFD